MKAINSWGLSLKKKATKRLKNKKMVKASRRKNR